jgi:hypothetical protein
MRSRICKSHIHLILLQQAIQMEVVIPQAEYLNNRLSVIFSGEQHSLD